MSDRMGPRRVFLRVAPWVVAACFAVLATLAVVALAAGYPRAALALLGVMLGVAVLGFVFIGAPWLILWPRRTRPPLRRYLRAVARGRPMTPPGATRPE